VGNDFTEKKYPPHNKRQTNDLISSALYTTSRRKRRESRSEVRNGQGPTESTKEPDT
jgi:hypothetical protein